MDKNENECLESRGKWKNFQWKFATILFHKQLSTERLQDMYIIFIHFWSHTML